MKNGDIFTKYCFTLPGRSFPPGNRSHEKPIKVYGRQAIGARVDVDIGQSKLTCSINRLFHKYQRRLTDVWIRKGKIRHDPTWKHSPKMKTGLDVFPLKIKKKLQVALEPVNPKPTLTHPRVIIRKNRFPICRADFDSSSHRLYCIREMRIGTGILRKF